jgi:hypothetical protein
VGRFSPSLLSTPAVIIEGKIHVALHQRILLIYRKIKGSRELCESNHEMQCRVKQKD